MFFINAVSTTPSKGPFTLRESERRMRFCFRMIENNVFHFINISLETKYDKQFLKKNQSILKLKYVEGLRVKYSGRVKHKKKV